jgi:hypothetical protein
MIAATTIAVPADGSEKDIFAEAVGSVMVQATAAHTVHLENIGSGDVLLRRLGGASGLPLAPDEKLTVRIAAGDRLAIAVRQSGTGQDVAVLIVTE